MRFRDWLGTLVTIAAAVLEHALGETVAVAALTAAVVVFGGLLWRRVSVLMAAPRANNCTKAYAVEARLVAHMASLNGLAPLVNANSVFNTNATFLAGLTEMATLPTDGNSGSNWGIGERDFYNNLISELRSSKLMS